MPEPTIVPPTPTINQGDRLSDAQTADSIQRAFDRAMPEIKTQATPKPPATPPPPSEPPPPPPPVPTEPVAPQTPPAPQPPETPAPHPKLAQPEDADVPSFLEQALRSDTPPEARPPAAPPEDEWPEELPTFKNSEEAKARYKKWRDAHHAQREELKAARNKPPQADPTLLQQNELLTNQNRQMQEMLSRVGVEHSEEFQQNIMRPLTGAWYEAARIVKDAGGDPTALAKAMTLTGKSQFEALDEIFVDLPDSAKAEAHDALRTYRQYETARQNYLRNAPQAIEGIRQRELQRQLAETGKQREEMKSIFDQAAKHLTESKLEVLLKTDLPDGDWWNKQSDQILDTARNLYLENTDMSRIAMACVLAPAAEAYRKLWLNSQKKIGQLQRVIKDKIGNEPDLSEHGGPGPLQTNDAQFKADLEKPFNEVFLRTFHKLQAEGK